MRRAWILLAALLLVPGGRSALGQQPGDGYAREALLRAARAAIDPDLPEAPDLETLRASLHADMPLMSAPRGTPEDEAHLERLRQVLDDRELLVGLDLEGEGVDAQGALQDARTLYRWLLGKFPCAVLVQQVRGGRDVNEPVVYPWPVPEPEVPVATETPAPEAPEPQAATSTGEGAAASPPPDGVEAPADPMAPPAPSPPRTPQALPEGVAKEFPADRPQTLEEWAPWVKAREGTLLRRRLLVGACDEIGRLEKASRKGPALAALFPDKDLHRFALVVDLPEAERERYDPYAYNLPLAALRALQAEERVREFDLEKPTHDLVDESTVREKQQRAETYRKAEEGLRARRRAIAAELDRMATGLAAWRVFLGELAVQIDEAARAQAAQAEGAEAEGGRGEAAGGDGAGEEAGAEGGVAPDAPTGKGLELRVLQAQSALASLELRLLYLTALRAEARTRILDRLIECAKAEAAAAQGASERFGAELRRMRRERQIQRLESEARSLAQMQEYVRNSVRPEARRDRLLGAADAILRLNERLRAAALLRREFAERLRPPPAEPAPEGVARDPRTMPWTLEEVHQAQQALREKRLGMDEVARHHEAVDRRIAALRAALASARDRAALHHGLEEAVTEARAALAVFDERTEPVLDAGSWPLRGMLLASATEVQENVQGMEAEVEDVRKRVLALEGYRDALLDQEARSFGIRLDRTLDAPELGAAFRDVAETMQQAVRWASLETSDGHAGTFFRDRWLGVLVTAVLAALLLVGVRVGRRRLDVWIEGRAAGIRQLRWTGASVKEERDVAREQRQRDVEAARATEDAVLRQAEGEVVGEPTAPDGPPGSPLAGGGPAGAAPAAPGAGTPAPAPVPAAPPDAPSAAPPGAPAAVPAAAPQAPAGLREAPR